MSANNLWKLGSALTKTTTAPWQRMFVRRLPLCTVETNLPKDLIPKDFASGLSKLIALTFNKPLDLVSVTLRTELSMVRGGTTEPTAVVQIWSIGVFDEQRNAAYAKKFADYVGPQLKLPYKRIVLFFHPINKEDAGHLSLLS